MHDKMSLHQLIHNSDFKLTPSIKLIIAKLKEF